MNNSDTPETDKTERLAFYSQHMVPTDFARKLELERNEWRKAAFEITQQANESRKELERERNEAQGAQRHLQALAQSVAETCAKLKEERDEAQAEVNRLQKGGCARDQKTTQFCAEVVNALKERDEARELAQQMSESNQVLLADVRFYRNAWEQLKKEKP
jgi:vacuolar-type H+-ATPase subunit I/STV1